MAGMCRLILAALCLTFSSGALAQQDHTSLTIYSSAKFDEFDASRLMKGSPNAIPGMSIVQQRRTLDLDEGESIVQLPDIAPAADFSTLTLRPSSPNAFKVLSQSLIEQAGDPEALLRRAIGHEVIINRKAPLLSDHTRTPETINAKLLAFDQNQIVVETNNRQLPVQIIARNAEIAEIKLMADSAAPTTRPALSARISASKSGAQEAIITYHANAITWHADYDLFQRDESKASFSATITILNRTGSAFDNARINLIAAPGSNLAAASRQIAQELAKRAYILPQPVSIPPDAAHRVTLADAPNISCQSILACTPADYAHSPTVASTYLAIDNTSKNGLGLSLPPGRIRVTRQADANAAPMLVADDIFVPSAPNDLILLRLGNPSQVGIKHEIKEHLDTDRSAMLQIIQLTLHNASDRGQKVVLVEPHPPTASGVLEKSDEYQTQSQGLVFTVDVPANGEKIITYTLRRPAQ